MQEKQKSTLYDSSLLRMFRRIVFYLGSTNKRNLEISVRQDLESSIAVFKENLEIARKEGHTENEGIFNIGLYLLMIQYDSSALAFQMFSEIDDWPKKVLARKFIIMMYESSNDLSRLLNQDLRPLLKGLPDSDELTEDLNHLMKRLNDFKASYQAKLGELRNNCSAHRDKDSLVQLEAIESIDVNWLHDPVAKEFMDIIRQLNLGLLGKVMQSIVKKHKQTIQDLRAKMGL